MVDGHVGANLLDVLKRVVEERKAGKELAPLPNH